MPLSKERAGTTPSSSLRHYQFLTTGKPQRFLDALDALPRQHDFESSVLILPGVEVITYGPETEAVPLLPLFRLRFGEARMILEDIWKPKANFGAAFSENLSIGIAVDSYAEYPDADIGPDECTYEVASWVA